MAKKKDKVVIPEISPDETVIEDAQPQDATYHATFTPTWRPELDCGDHDSVEDAQAAIERTANEFEADVVLGWHRETPDTWLATGHDGRVDTLMPIAKITRVSA